MVVKQTAVTTCYIWVASENVSSLYSHPETSVFTPASHGLQYLWILLQILCTYVNMLVSHVCMLFIFHFLCFAGSVNILRNSCLIDPLSLQHLSEQLVLWLEGHLNLRKTKRLKKKIMDVKCTIQSLPKGGLPNFT